MSQENEKEMENQENEEISEEPMTLPPVTFENFIFGLYNTVLFHLGFRDPESGKIIRNLPLARHSIDTLGMIQEKTKGNLSAPEGNLLDNLLYELRMNYLRTAKQAEEEAKTPPEEKPEGEEKKPDS